MTTRGPSLWRVLVAVGFALSCFGLLLFLWIAFGGPTPLRPTGYEITADFPEAAIVRLEQNYRSTEVILGAASAVIANNRNRKEKALWTDRKGGDKIRYFRGADELEEAEYITRIARAALDSHTEKEIQDALDRVAATSS